MKQIWHYTPAGNFAVNDVKQLPQPMVHMLANSPNYFSICDNFLRGYSGFDYTRMFGEFDGPNFPKGNGRFFWIRPAGKKPWLVNNYDLTSTETSNARYEMGLGYVKLGQPSTTLSGGECQRVKLSGELAKHETGNTLYILDEPTTGLHFEDVRMLLDVLQRLVSHGNTVIIIEHNLDVIKNVDWVIDLGPEGGDKGGEVVFVGTPEELAKEEKSYTGQFLSRFY